MHEVWSRVWAYVDARQEVGVRTTPALLAAFECIAAGRVSDFKPLSIARESGYPARTLCRSARRVLGVSLTEYMLVYRIGEAARLLDRTDLQVSVIVRLLGFNDRSTLRRPFLSEFGISPTAFRARERARAAALRPREAPPPPLGPVRVGGNPSVAASSVSP